MRPVTIGATLALGLAALSVSDTYSSHSAATDRSTQNIADARLAYCGLSDRHGGC
jgi:hypothetical protein